MKNRCMEWMRKNRNKIKGWLRRVIQLGFFLFFPSVFTAAFAGVKYIFTQLGAGEQLEVTAFLTTLIVLCLYTVVCGRFFCGFACAFGSFGDLLHELYLLVFRKLKKKPVLLSRKWTKYLAAGKYVVLAAVAVLCFLGTYSSLRGVSPWDVFSMIRVGNFRLTGYGIGIALLLLIMVGMCVEERFFCRFLCPMGAVFSLLPVLPIFTPRRDRQNCIHGCNACGRKCPVEIEVPDCGSPGISGECIQCKKCMAVCPKGNIRSIAGFPGQEVLLTLVEAAALLGLYLWLGV